MVQNHRILDVFVTNQEKGKSGRGGDDYEEDLRSNFDAEDEEEADEDGEEEQGESGDAEEAVEEDEAEDAVVDDQAQKGACRAEADSGDSKPCAEWAQSLSRPGEPDAKRQKNKESADSR